MAHKVALNSFFSFAGLAVVKFLKIETYVAPGGSLDW